MSKGRYWGNAFDSTGSRESNPKSDAACREAKNLATYFGPTRRTHGQREREREAKRTTPFRQSCCHWPGSPGRKTRTQLPQGTLAGAGTDGTNGGKTTKERDATLVVGHQTLTLILFCCCRRLCGVVYPRAQDPAHALAVVDLPAVATSCFAIDALMAVALSAERA